MIDSIPFTKMSGSGNDFIVIDNRQGIVPEDNRPLFVERVCRRKLSTGADGMILVENSDRVDFKWNFFNSDGSVAEMCGNGARCVARFAYLRGIAQERMRFETIAGIIHAQVMQNHVKVRMTDPFDMTAGETVEIDADALNYSSINTGVPHVVIEVDDIHSVDVIGVGRKIRQHSLFAPDGTNVNFVAPQSSGSWTVRTYERGVEDETLACGTGIVAAALVLAQSKGVESPATLTTQSGSRLKVYFAKEGRKYRQIYLCGDARMIYEGQLLPDSWLYE